MVEVVVDEPVANALFGSVSRFVSAPHSGSFGGCDEVGMDQVEIVEVGVDDVGAEDVGMVEVSEPSDPDSIPTPGT